MTTIEAEIKLMEYFDIRKNLIVPNVSDWSTLIRFESDILVLSKSGYATSIEIKVSKSDLRADLKKPHIKYFGQIRNGKNQTELYYKNIKYFYYAVPNKIIYEAHLQIPSFSGLINLDTMKIFREPKVLFKTKWSEEMRYKLARLGAMRILNLKRKLINN